MGANSSKPLICLSALLLALSVSAQVAADPDKSADAPSFVAFDYSPNSLRPADWYEEHHVVLHTRLSLTWLNKPAFTNAESAFTSMGAKAYTRWIKGGNEGAWWSSSVGIQDSRTIGRDVASEILDRAHANGLHLVVYHRHIEDAYMAQQHPGWVCLNANGTTATTNRGDYMCLNSPYLDYFTTRQLELIARGADGFYFDEKHMPPEGCWCSYCRARFTAETGLAPPPSVDYANPVYLRFLQFKNESIERGMGHYVEAAHAISPGMPMLVSITYVPHLHSPLMRSHLARVAPSPKSEYEMAIRKGNNDFFTAKPKTPIPPPDWDVQLGFAWSYHRDAAQGRPSHLWANDTRSAKERLAASAALMTYGHIANLDIDEGTIPDFTFTPALQMGEKVSPYLARTRPVRWAAIHFTERGRDQYLTDLTGMYQCLLLPCWQVFQALYRMRAPVGVVTDEQIALDELGGYKVLILPMPDVLSAQEQANVNAFAAAGGKVIELKPDARWYTKGQQEAIRAEFLNDLLTTTGSPPVSMTGGTTGTHAVAVMRPDDPNRVVVCVTNEFTWLGVMQQHRLDGDYTTTSAGIPPQPVTNAVLTLKGPKPKRVFEALTDQEITPAQVESGVQIAVPAFDFMAAVVVEYEPSASRVKSWLAY